MLYRSTRNDKKNNYSAAEVILQGLAPDGGLFTPVEIPQFKQWESLLELSYSRRAAALMQPYLDSFSEKEINAFCTAAYDSGRFGHPSVAPLRRITKNLFFLELWHGPTCAFKDMALQILPHLVRGAAAKNRDTAQRLILTATSGDTGKAALEGFRDIPGTRIVVFFPVDGVSEIQKMQMITQEGSNVHVIAIRGNFDAAQGGVKEIFADGELTAELAARGYRLSSANSINWGRLVPQIAYYFSAYLDLVREREIRAGEPVDFVVPTGNFGNILAGFYARQMGLPLRKLICASNENNVLTDFINTGCYDRNRTFHCTISPSMDILVSSNLERLLFELCGRDPQKVKGWMEQLNKTGRYRIDPQTHKAIKDFFDAGYATEEETYTAISRTYREHNYLIDPHTAVARAVYDKIYGDAGSEVKTVIVSTASPFKFNASVALAVLGRDRVAGHSEFELLELLSKATGAAVPPGLSGLESRAVRHPMVIRREQMKETLLGLLP